jgi:hypothetical protein
MHKHKGINKIHKGEINMYKYKYKYKYRNIHDYTIQLKEKCNRKFENDSAGIHQSDKYVQVKNEGAFAARFTVEFDFLQKPMYRVQGSFPVPQSRTLYLPISASNVTVFGVAITGKTREHRPTSLPACYTMTGTTGSPNLNKLESC